MIYLDNAATTLIKPERVINSMTEALKTFGNSSRGTHSSGLNASFAVYEAREKISAFFGCSNACCTAFALNATHALNTAINGILKPGDHVISTDWEHNSVLRPLYRLQKERGIETDFLASDPNGNIDYSQIKNYVRRNTKAVICTHASNVTGNTADFEQIGRTAKEYGLIFIADTAQTAGSAEINMKRMNIDVLCFTGHKGLMGPQGTGGLCINGDIQIDPFAVGGTGVQSYNQQQPSEMPARLEAGTLNGHGIAGLSAALDFINEIGLDKIREHEMKLHNIFLDGIKKIKNVKIYGRTNGPKTALVSINIGDLPSGTAADILFQKYGIEVRPGIHCAPKMHEALKTDKQGTVRFSFSYFNTEAEAEAAVKAVYETAALL